MPETEAAMSVPASRSGAARSLRSVEGSVWVSYLMWLLLGAGAALSFAAMAGLLAPVTGATQSARGAAVAAMLLSAAAGLLAARDSARSAPVFLLVAALFAGASPWILPLLEPAGGAILGLALGSERLLPLLRLAVALPLVIVPWGCLGAAFALLLRSQGWGAADRASRALWAAVLAAGAALGTVNAGFRLFPWGGERAVALAGAILLFVTAILCGAAGRKRRSGAAGAASSSLPGASPAASPAPAERVAAWGAFIWGIVAGTCLPAWDRILRLVFGPFPESMSRTAGVFLAGCALGSLALLFWRGGGRRRPLAIACLAGLAGIAAAGMLFFLNSLPLQYLAIAPLAFTAPFSFFVKSWGVAALPVLPAGILLGALLPLLWGADRFAEAGAGARDNPGAQGGPGVAGGPVASGDPGEGEGSSKGAGAVEAADRRGGAGGIAPLARILAGAFLASVLVPSWVIPHFGFRSALVGAAALILAFSGVAFAFSSRESRLLRLAGMAAVLAATLFLAFRGLPGDPRLLASGVHRYARQILSTFHQNLPAYRAARLKTDLTFYREGREATVGVEQVEAETSPIVALTEDGAVEATTYFDLVPQILSAEIPMLMRPEARDVFLAGYGSGIGAGSILLHPLASLDVAEPEEAVVEASGSFEPANRVPRSDPRVRIYHEDPRLVLRARGKASYDVILFRPTAPEDSFARFQFTVSFYRLAASRLREGGLFAQVLPLQGFSPVDLASVARTARSVFGDVMILQSYYQEGLLLASGRPLRFDLEGMRAAIEADRVRSDLGRIGLASVDALVVRHRLSGDGLEAFARDGRVLVDPGPTVSWEGFRIGGKSTANDSQNAMDRYSTGLAKCIAGLPDGAPGNAVLVELAQAAIAVGDAMRAADLADALLSRGDAADGHQVLGDAYYLRREQIPSVTEWHKALDADPKNVNALRSLADFSSDRQNYEAAEEYLRRALEARPGDASLLFYHGRALFNLKRYKQSEADLAKSVQLQGEKKVPLALYYLGLIQKDKGNLTGAAEFLRRYLQWAYAQGRLTPVEAEVHFALAEIYKGMNLPDLAEQQKKAGDVLQAKLKEAAKSKEQAAIEWLKKP